MTLDDINIKRINIAERPATITTSNIQIQHSRTESDIISGEAAFIPSNNNIQEHSYLQYKIEL